MIVAQLLLELFKNKIRPVSKNHPVLLKILKAEISQQILFSKNNNYNNYMESTYIALIDMCFDTHYYTERPKNHIHILSAS